MKKKRSPRIINIFWGHMEVEGLGTAKDFKLYLAAGAHGTGGRPTPSTCRASSLRTSRSCSTGAAGWWCSAVGCN
jgi:hypothetical protein